MTEDHTVKYGNFEGIIPKDKYGAGTVMIWDYGTYKNIKKKDGKLIPIKKCLIDGQIEIHLKGKKLNGGFALVRIKDKENHWLLIKMKDKEASTKKNPVKTQPNSAKTQKTMHDIAKL